MGRLPDTFAGQPIKSRVPFTLSAEMIISSDTGPLMFQTSSFMMTQNKPFEAHRFIPRVQAVDVSSNPADGVENDVMMRLLDVSILDTGKNQWLTKHPVSLYDLVKGTTEKTWEWADPYYLREGESFTVELTSGVFPAALNDLRIRAKLCFEGFLIVIAPPTERR